MVLIRTLYRHGSIDMVLITTLSLSAVNMETVQQHSPTVVIIQSEAVGPMGDTPCMTQCSNCHQRVTTVVTNRPGVAAWAMCGLLTLMG